MPHGEGLLILTFQLIYDLKKKLKSAYILLISWKILHHCTSRLCSFDSACLLDSLLSHQNKQTKKLLNSTEEL